MEDPVDILNDINNSATEMEVWPEVFKINGILVMKEMNLIVGLDGKPLVAKTTCKNHFSKLTPTQRSRIIKDYNNLSDKMKDTIISKVGKVEVPLQKSNKKNDICRIVTMYVDPSLQTMWNKVFEVLTRNELDDKEYRLTGAWQSIVDIFNNRNTYKFDHLAEMDEDAAEYCNDLNPNELTSIVRDVSWFKTTFSQMKTSYVSVRNRFCSSGKGNTENETLTFITDYAKGDGILIYCWVALGGSAENKFVERFGKILPSGCGDETTVENTKVIYYLHKYILLYVHVHIHRQLPLSV